MVSRQGFEEYCFSDSVLRPDKAGLSADLLKNTKKTVKLLVGTIFLLSLHSLSENTSAGKTILERW